MTDQTEAINNLIAQDADLIEICPDDLVQQLFAEADNFKVDREVGVRPMLISSSRYLCRYRGFVMSDTEQKPQYSLTPPRIWLWIVPSDDGASSHIRKWSHAPFPEGTEYNPATPTPTKGDNHD